MKVKVIDNSYKNREKNGLKSNHIFGINFSFISSVEREKNLTKKKILNLN